MSNANLSSEDKYLILIGAALEDAENGGQGLSSYIANEDAFFEENAQGLYGVSWEGLKKAGKELWSKTSPKLHKAFCDTTSDDHKTIAGMIKSGSKEVAPAVASMIATVLLGLEIIPAAALGTVAYFLAKLILQSFFESAYEKGCEKWEKSLKTEEG